ncbi:MAG: phage holin family protein [Oscillospiraceae bacterium]|jgi:toxin secretion/phage lysis holin|nr:phage holin family protein [Oscillospiraceae bacterium]
MKNVKNCFIGIGTLLSSWLGILYVPMLILILCNVIDYGTGLCAAKYRDETIKSYKSIRGIAKKVCMWLLVAVGAMLDWLLQYAAETVGITIGLNFVVASIVAVWLIANEIISILENVKDIGAPLPPFLMKIASNIKSQAEKKAESEEFENENE